MEMLWPQRLWACVFVKPGNLFLFKCSILLGELTYHGHSSCFQSLQACFDICSVLTQSHPHSSHIKFTRAIMFSCESLPSPNLYDMLAKFEIDRNCETLETHEQYYMKTSKLYTLSLF